MAEAAFERSEIDYSRAGQILAQVIGSKVSPDSYCILGTLCLILDRADSGQTEQSAEIPNVFRFILEADCQWTLLDREQRQLLDSRMICGCVPSDDQPRSESNNSISLIINMMLEGKHGDVEIRPPRNFELTVSSVTVQPKGKVALRLSSDQTLMLRYIMQEDDEWFLYKSGRLACSFFAEKGFYQRLE
jgi:hypothetical protein